MEHKAVAGIQLVRPVHLARYHDAQRRRAALHDTNLHRGGVAAQEGPAVLRGGGRSIEKKRVERFPRGMVARNIERVEVIVLGFHLRAFHDLEAHRHEDGEDRVDRLGDGVQPALRVGAPRQGDIEGVVRLRGRQRLAACGELSLQRCLDLVDALAECGALLDGEIANAFHEPGQPALAAEPRHPLRLQ